MHIEDEHEFYGYWRWRIDQEGTLQHHELEQIMRQNKQPYTGGVGALIGMLCQRDALPLEEANWLFQLLEPPSWGRD